MNVKLTNENYSLIIAASKLHELRHSVTFFVFSLLCCEYVCDIYLHMMDFKGTLMQLWKSVNIFVFT